MLEFWVEPGILLVRRCLFLFVPLLHVDASVEGFIEIYNFSACLWKNFDGMISFVYSNVSDWIMWDKISSRNGSSKLPSAFCLASNLHLSGPLKFLPQGMYKKT